MKNEKLIIAKKKYNSRLIVGTGKYKSFSECAKAIKLKDYEIPEETTLSVTIHSAHII